MKHSANTTTKSPRPVMRTATWLNVSYGLVETAVGGVSGSSAALANGVHNFSDGLSHAMHTATHIEETNRNNVQNKVQRKRRWAAGAIAVGALLTGANAIQNLTDATEEPLNVQALTVELGAIAINAGLIVAIKRRNDGTLAYTDALRHHIVDASMAGVTSTAIYVNQFVAGADGIGGLIASGASGWLAYKTAQYHTKNSATQSE